MAAKVVHAVVRGEAHEYDYDCEMWSPCARVTLCGIEHGHIAVVVSTAQTHKSGLYKNPNLSL